ncbi:MAG: putative glycolipid-binding domain-containing protein [Acidimicrobiaceae bacterium]|nr:putative glycolipid-binding domain-containing protein [Acidimicrobiaceae bacterium]
MGIIRQRYRDPHVLAVRSRPRPHRARRALDHLGRRARGDRHHPLGERGLHRHRPRRAGAGGVRAAPVSHLAGPPVHPLRDLEEPDLWLATDGHGRWGEMNGSHRTELDGCYDIDLACTPFTNTLPIRRLPLHEGDSAELPVVYVDPETLEVRPVTQRYTRTAGHTWRYESVDTGYVTTFEVDEHGLVLDYPDEFRRVS